MTECITCVKTLSSSPSFRHGQGPHSQERSDSPGISVVSSCLSPLLPWSGESQATQNGAHLPLWKEAWRHQRYCFQKFYSPTLPFSHSPCSRNQGIPVWLLPKFVLLWDDEQCLEWCSRGLRHTCLVISRDFSPQWVVCWRPCLLAWGLHWDHWD